MGCSTSKSANLSVRRSPSRHNSTQTLDPSFSPDGPGIRGSRTNLHPHDELRPRLSKRSSSMESNGSRRHSPRRSSSPRRSNESNSLSITGSIGRSDSPRSPHLGVQERHRPHSNSSYNNSRPDVRIVPPKITILDSDDDAASNSQVQNTLEGHLGRLRPGELFVDPDFPPSSSSVSPSPDHAARRLEWKRPHELVSSPKLLEDGFSREDIQQGVLGDCWFLSAAAALASHPNLLEKVVPTDQPLQGANYRGVIKFNIWRYGRWNLVYVDDLLPTKAGALVYGRCDSPSEFWLALLEKAYAKLHGCYEALEGGHTRDGLVDLTGGVAESYDITGYDVNLFRVLERALALRGFVVCSRKGDWKTNKPSKDGLVSGHAYTITGIRRLKHKMGKEELVRLRNPWGNETEWKGSWGDGDSNWDWVDDKMRQEMNQSNRPDGEFWMSFRDFAAHFQEVTVASLGVDLDGDLQADEARLRTARGKWEIGKTAGGSRNNISSFATNPQYLLTLLHADDKSEADDPLSAGKCSILVSLMQGSRRRQKTGPLLQIAFFIYRVDNLSEPLATTHFKYNYEDHRSGQHINYREVTGRLLVDPGCYVIVPSSFNAGEAGSFLIRVFAQKDFPALKKLQ